MLNTMADFMVEMKVCTKEEIGHLKEAASLGEAKMTMCTG